MRFWRVAAYVACAVFAFVVVLAAQTTSQNPPAQAPGTQPQTGAQTQPGAPRQPLSPRGQAEFTFADGKKITVDYGRPYIRGRKIMGGLVPYGQVWRTGANAATSFVTDTTLNIGGTTVPAGSYTLYTLPNENDWKLIINKQTKQWGTEYHQEQDLARIDMKTERLQSPVDQFTISFDKQGPSAGVMNLEWENTKASANFSEVNK